MISHPFRLIDPPPGQAEVIEAAIAAIDYPWERIGGVIDVVWTTEGSNTASATYWDGPDEIRMSARPHHMDNPESVAFAFAHEVGHMIDDRTLTDAARADLTALLHVGPFVRLGHVNHDHPDVGHVSEGWADNGNPYISRLNEAFADQFVAAFAPTVWEGHWPRFVHWTDDHDAVRRVILAASEPRVTATATPIPESEETIVRHQHPRLVDRLQRLRRITKRLRRRVRRLRKK